MSRIARHRWGFALTLFALSYSPSPIAAQGKPAEAPSVTYRKAVMDGLSAHVRALRALLGSDIGHAPDVRKHTAALLASAVMFDSIFAPPSNPATSNAKSDIWSISDEFHAQTRDFQDAARALDQEAGRGGENTVLMPRLQMVIGTCGSCHTAFKLPAPLP